MQADFTMSDGAVTALPPHDNPIGTDPTETVGYSLGGGGLLERIQPSAHRNHFFEISHASLSLDVRVAVIWAGVSFYFFYKFNIVYYSVIVGSLKYDEVCVELLHLHASGCLATIRR